MVFGAARERHQALLRGTGLHHRSAQYKYTYEKTCSEEPHYHVVKVTIL
jgi:hypothetical protein